MMLGVLVTVLFWELSDQGVIPTENIFHKLLIAGGMVFTTLIVSLILLGRGEDVP